MRSGGNHCEAAGAVVKTREKTPRLQDRREVTHERRPFRERRSKAAAGQTENVPNRRNFRTHAEGVSRTRPEVHCSRSTPSSPRRTRAAQGFLAPSLCPSPSYALPCQSGPAGRPPERLPVLPASGPGGENTGRGCGGTCAPGDDRTCLTPRRPCFRPTRREAGSAALRRPCPQASRSTPGQF